MPFDINNIKYFFTTGDGADADSTIPQNDKTKSTGGKCSTTELFEGIDNVFKEWSTAQLSASTRYSCLCVKNLNPNAFNTARFLAKDINTYPAEVTISIGVQTNDSSTAAPVKADEFTPPAGITFVSLEEWTGDTFIDNPLAYPVGPLNAPADGVTDLNLADDMRVFLYIKFECASVVDSLDDLYFSTPLIGVADIGLPYELAHTLGDDS